VRKKVWAIGIQGTSPPLIKKGAPPAGDLFVGDI